MDAFSEAFLYKRKAVYVRVETLINFQKLHKIRHFLSTPSYLNGQKFTVKVSILIVYFHKY